MNRRKNLALRYCFVAWASLLRWVALLAIVGVLLALVVTQNNVFLWVAAGLVVVMLVSALIYFIEQQAVRCLMCGASLLNKLGCIPHGNAKKLGGSHTLRATVKLATLPHLMDCPFCDGHFRLGAKEGERSARQGGSTSTRATRHSGKSAGVLPEASSSSRDRR